VAFLGFDGEGKLLYATATEIGGGDGYPDNSYALRDEDNHLIDSRTGNFLTNAETYTLHPDTQGGMAIGRPYNERPNDIAEGRETITPEILDEVAKQELTILKFYRLIDQQHFEEAYQMLKESQLSFEAFVEKWQQFSLVDIERIQTPQIFFDSYPASTQAYLKGLGNLNEFKVRLFVRNLSGDTFYQDETLHIHNATQVELLSSLAQYDVVWTHKEDVARLYYHLIASHRFEEAYAMQDNPSQPLEAFRATYADLIGIVVQTSEVLYCNEQGDCSASSLDDTNEGPVQMVIDFIREQGTERIYLELEINNDKVKFLSSRPETHPCISCAYGYKPVIYLYPPQPTEIKV
jgi:hypothetical protein